MRVDIVGAGPAGLALSLDLLHEGGSDRFDVHIWERRSAVGTTPCGEGLHEARLGLLRGFDSAGFVGARLRGAAVDAPDAKRVVVEVPCATMRRSAWLPAMAEAAVARGARLHMDQFLNEEAIRSLPGDVVVGADGPSSRVARIVGSDKLFMPATQLRLSETPALDGLLIFRWDPEYSTDYSWVFPRGDHTSVGALAPASRHVFDQLRALAASYGVDGSLVREESYPIPYGGRRVVAGRYVLLGDAAGVANPLTKGGMGPAFIQAKMLADALRDGGLETFEDDCKGHPLFSRLPIKALKAMHSLARGDVRRMVGRGPGTLELQGSATMRVLGRTMATADPALWAKGFTLVRALRHAIRWGW